MKISYYTAVWTIFWYIPIVACSKERFHHFIIQRKLKLTDGGRTMLMNVVNDHVQAPAIHVEVGEILVVNVTNQLPDQGLSIHWHGFEMRGSNIYDGVVGITQCAIAPGESFVYRFVVHEVPGTYWWHTHAGEEDPLAHDKVRGPLIVHPKGLSTDNKGFPHGYSYANEKILFLQERSMYHPSVAWAHTMGGLYGQPSRDEEGFGVGTLPWRGGYINGREHAVIDVNPGRTYLLRVINGGNMYPYIFGIDGLKLTVVGTDGAPCLPFETNQVYIHNAERFDVLLRVPEKPGLFSRWIRANTSESHMQGYSNAITGVLRIRTNAAISTNELTPLSKPVLEPVMLNCHQLSVIPIERCIPITALKPAIKPDTVIMNGSAGSDIVIHTVDSAFFPPPQFAHVVRVNQGVFHQHMNPLSAVLHPNTTSSHRHPNEVTLMVPLNRPLLLIFRTNSLFAHPMHIHGHKFEVLAVAHRHPTKDCDLEECPFIDAEQLFGVSSLQELGQVQRGGVLKDTVVMPPGGAVALRLFTNNPGTWFAHCHIGDHRSDGMAFILQEGELSTNHSFPPDYPSCNYTGRLQQPHHTSCNCHKNTDTTLKMKLTTEDKCSMPHLCRHVSPDRVKKERYATGIATHKDHGIARWVIPGVTVTVTLLLYFLLRWASSKTGNIENLTMGSGFWKILRYELMEARNECINVTRLVEVIGLAFTTGLLFFDVGRSNTNRNLRETFSLLFFSTTLWTFTRMYPSVAAHNRWRERVIDLTLTQAVPLHYIVTARVISYIAAEMWWPLLYSSIAFPMAHVVGEPWVWFSHSLRLVLNSLCYIFFGAVAGLGAKKLPSAMIFTTIYAQSSLLCAGFYRTLPAWLQWCRYISFLFYSYSGMIHTGYKWHESYECVNGDSRLDPNHCFLQTSASVDDLRLRGIDVTVPSGTAENVLHEWSMVVLIAYMFLLNFIMYCILWSWVQTKKPLAQPVDIQEGS